MEENSVISVVDQKEKNGFAPNVRIMNGALTRTQHTMVG
jgi:hypothetical protein